MTDPAAHRVYPLGELDDYEVADDDPDVRGWSVFGADGIELGEVDELIVDPQARKVRYLAVDLKHDETRTEDRTVLVPVGAARLREDRNNVMLDSMSTMELAALPAYRRDAFSEEYEDDLRRRFAVDRTGARADATYYDHDMYDDNRFYGSRRR